MKKKIVAIISVVSLICTMGMTALAAESSTTVINSAADKVAEQVVAAVEQAVVTNGDAAQAVEQVMTTPATAAFDATIKALNGDIAFNNMGTKKTLATAVDAFGNKISAVSKINGVTSGSLVMLYAVMADGTVEVVEGIVDPVSGLILGIFKGTPATITTMVIIPASAK